MSPRRARAARLLARRGAVVLAVAITAMSAGAQVRATPPAGGDTTRRAAPPAADTTTRAAGPRRRGAGAAPRPGLTPPVTPKRALISSLLLPGLGQTRLQRPTAGVIFAAAEMGAIAMMAKSMAELRSARALRADSISTVIPLDTLGRPLRLPLRAVGNFTDDLVRARSLHVEDWVAVILFNHLISGAEAYVSAQLYDLPAQISARPTPRGAALAVRVAW